MLIPDIKIKDYKIGYENNVNIRTKIKNSYPSFKGIADTDDVSAVSIIVKKCRNYQIFI